MAFTRPTLQQIIDRIEGDIKSGLGLTTVLRRSFEAIIAKAFAGASHTLHGHIDFAQNQLFPDSADEEFLLRWGSIFGLPRNEATFAQLNLDVTATTGGTVPAGTIYQRSDGSQYTVDDEVIIPAATTDTVVVTASDAGSDGNVSDGSTLSLISAIAGIETDAIVASTETEGEDQETVEEFRTRLIERIQAPPAGGKVTDYIAFAKTVTGVTRVWVLPDGVGEGTVVLWFVEDNEVPIIPDTPKIEEVQETVDALKPISADLFVVAPTTFPIDPTIALKPNTTEVRAAVITELEDMVFREAQVAESLDPTEVGIGTVFSGKIPLSKINEAISIAAGEEDHVLTLPTSDIEPSQGGLVTVGTVIFTTLV